MVKIQLYIEGRDNMLPKDPAILLSFINTKLRDKYSSLEALCEDLDEDRELVQQRLKMIGYVYDEKLNRFI